MKRASSSGGSDSLLRRAKAGDQAAREALLGGHRERLKLVLLRRMDPRLKGRVDASDLVQETLIEAFEKLDEYLEEPPLPLFPWLRQLGLGVLYHHFRYHVRTQKRSVDREIRELDFVSHSAAPFIAQRIADGVAEPGARAGLAEQVELVRRCLESMDPTDRDVLTLRFYEGLKSSEVGAILKLSESNVRVRQLRALRSLRQLMRGGGGAGGSPD